MPFGPRPIIWTPGELRIRLRGAELRNCCIGRLLKELGVIVTRSFEFRIAVVDKLSEKAPLFSPVFVVRRGGTPKYIPGRLALLQPLALLGAPWRSCSLEFLPMINADYVLRRHKRI